MRKKTLSESDICAKCIMPAVIQAGWDEATQIRREVGFTRGRIIVRGKLVTRGKARRADYVLYYQHLPMALIEAKDNHHALGDQLEAAKTEREQSRDRLVADSLHRLNSPADVAETDAPDLPSRQADAFRDHARFVFNHLPRLTTRPEHSKQLRQTILNLAVRGKLVPQDPNDEPASELLNLESIQFTQTN